MKVLTYQGGEIVKDTPVKGSVYDTVKQMAMSLDKHSEADPDREMALVDKKEVARLFTCAGKVEANMPVENYLWLLRQAGRVAKIERRLSEKDEEA